MKKTLINSRLYINTLTNQGSVRRQVLIISFVIILAVGFIYFEFWGKEKPEEIKKGLVVTSIEKEYGVFTDIKINGYVNGDGWIAFEGQVGTVKLLDKEDKEIAFALLSTVGDWMVNPPVYFQTSIRILPEEGEKAATLLFLNENPSGLPENNREFRLPIEIKKYEGEKIQIKVYFNNKNMDPEFSCNKVFSVERETPKGPNGYPAVARAALEELLKGPTKQEESQGFFTSINSGVKIQKLTIEDGTAKVDFDEQLEYQVGGSCRVAAIRAQITETLKQFPTVDNVIISINDRTEDILQP